MQDKDYIKQLYQEGLTCAEIARRIGISRQRAHQIATNYKNYGLDSFDKKTFRLLKKICEKCGKKAILCHHRDGNNSNSTIKNLQPLCKNCHTIVHKRLRQKNKKIRICEVCGSIFEILLSKNKERKKCKLCIDYERRQKTKKTKRKHLRKHERSSFCLGCKKIFTKKKPHCQKNLCKTCFPRYRYKTNEKYRAYLKEWIKKWCKNNPERRKEISRKASKKWQEKNKKKYDII